MSEKNEYEFDLLWHALNYRGASTVNSQEEWLQLVACVNRLIERGEKYVD